MHQSGGDDTRFGYHQGQFQCDSGGISHPALLFSQWTAPHTLDQEQYHYSRDCTVASSDGQE